ncbi:hypothetical protein RUND412_008560 [Rhizina undulata]
MPQGKDKVDKAGQDKVDKAGQGEAGQDEAGQDEATQGKALILTLGLGKLQGLKVERQSS